MTCLTWQTAHLCHLAALARSHRHREGNGRDWTPGAALPQASRVYRCISVVPALTRCWCQDGRQVTGEEEAV